MRVSGMTVMISCSSEIITAVFRKGPCSLIMRFVDFYLSVNESRSARTKGGRLLIYCHCYDTIGGLRARYVICNQH